MKFINQVKKYSFLLGIALFFIVLFNIDIKATYSILAKVKIIYLIVSLPPIFLYLYCIKGYQWNYLKKKLDIKYSLKDSIIMYGTSILIGLITPSRLGELTKVLYLKKDGYPLPKALTSIILDRLMDIIFLVFFGYLGLLYFNNLFSKQLILIISLIIAFGLFFLSFIYLKKKLARVIFEKIFAKLIPKKYQNNWKIDTKEFFAAFKKYSYANLLYVFFITCSYWFFYYLLVFILARSLDIKISFFYLALAITAVNFINLLPISIAGLGTREATLLLILVPLNISGGKIISLSLLILMLSIITAIIGLYCWIKKPLPLLFKNHESK